MKRIVLAVTGASGIAYALALATSLKKTHELHVIVSDNAKKVMEYEEKNALKALAKCGKIYSEHQIDASIASGSFKYEAMIVCPCSMKTLAAIACGFSHNLISRAADVCIKEQRKLVLVPREMPFSAIHLENMLKLARIGVVILPACPGFYHGPRKIGDLINHVVGKILDVLGVENSLFKRWS
ncbi:UbiX family flavin prenyltransferase [Candidatus Micrarchaeota archaeon]|nr:UbiX family flavin prenyltransferase [Candidatus Micrarchaeota archaeon]